MVLEIKNPYYHIVWLLAETLGWHNLYYNTDTDAIKERANDVIGTKHSKTSNQS